MPSVNLFHLYRRAGIAVTPQNSAESIKKKEIPQSFEDFSRKTVIQGAAGEQLSYSSPLSNWMTL
jgi:hypothetical protein